MVSQIHVSVDWTETCSWNLLVVVGGQKLQTSLGSPRRRSELNAFHVAGSTWLYPLGRVLPWSLYHLFSSKSASHSNPFLHSSPHLLPLYNLEKTLTIDCYLLSLCPVLLSLLFHFDWSFVPHILSGDSPRILRTPALDINWVVSPSVLPSQAQNKIQSIAKAYSSPDPLLLCPHAGRITTIQISPSQDNHKSQSKALHYVIVGCIPLSHLPSLDLIVIALWYVSQIALTLSFQVIPRGQQPVSYSHPHFPSVRQASISVLRQLSVHLFSLDMILHRPARFHQLTVESFYLCIAGTSPLLGI